MAATEDRARSIFLAALDRPPDGWPALLDEACGADADLRARVGRLLHAHRAIGSIHRGGPGAPTPGAPSPPPGPPPPPTGPPRTPRPWPPAPPPTAPGR